MNREKHAAIKKPFIPAERRETIRQNIISILRGHRGQNLSAKGISAHVSASEKQVYEHLGHIRQTIKKEYQLIITPAECKKCGFIFKKRERLKKPGKCPVCRSESILEPLFSIR